MSATAFSCSRSAREDGRLHKPARECRLDYEGLRGSIELDDGQVLTATVVVDVEIEPGSWLASDQNLG